MSDFLSARWRKSSYSNPAGSDCVEVAFAAGHVGVRDSKNPLGGHLAFTPSAWNVFVKDVDSVSHEKWDRHGNLPTSD